MISAKKLVKEFQRRYDRIDTGRNSSIGVEDICSYLNEAQIIYFENRVAVSEFNDLVREDLRKLEIKNKELSVSDTGNNWCYFVFPQGYYKSTRMQVLAEKPGCGERFLSPIVVRQDKFNSVIDDPFWRPSFEWEETLVQVSGDGVFVYTDGFSVKKLVLDYYRKPQEIHAPSLVSGEYEDYSGKVIKKDYGLELDNTYSWRKIVDIAVLIAQRDKLEIQDFEMQLKKILTLDKIHTV